MGTRELSWLQLSLSSQEVQRIKPAESDYKQRCEGGIDQYDNAPTIGHSFFSSRFFRSLANLNLPGSGTIESYVSQMIAPNRYEEILIVFWEFMFLIPF